MKRETFYKMIINPPLGATHYRHFRTNVVFYRNIDNIFGSYDSSVWYDDEDYPDEQWYTRRNFIDYSKIQEL